MARRKRRKRKRKGQKPAVAQKPAGPAVPEHKLGNEQAKWPRSSLVVGLVAVVLALGAILLFRPLSNEARPSSAPPTTADSVELANLGDLDPLVAEQIRQDMASVRQDSSNGATYGRLGRTYHAHNYYELAQRCYEIAYRLAPETPDWPYYLGILASEEGDESGAVEHFRAMLVLSPHYLAAYHRLGNALLAQGRLKQAEAAFGALLIRAPDQPWGHLGAAKLARRSERSEEAVHHLQRAFEIDPTVEEVAYLLAMTLSDLGRKDEAARYLQGLESGAEKALPPDPLNDAVLAGRKGLMLMLVQVNRQLREGKLQEAESVYRMVLSHDPDRLEAILGLARLWGQMGRVAEARAGFQRAATLRPESTTAHLGVALSHFTLGRAEQGREALDRVFALDPQHEQAHRMLQDWESGALVPEPAAVAAETAPLAKLRCG